METAITLKQKVHVSQFLLLFIVCVAQFQA